VRIQELIPARDKAIVELDERVTMTPSGLHVVHENAGQNYRPEEDYETGVVAALGESEHGWEPVEVGDRVVVRAQSGGAAGADISNQLDRPAGEVIVVLRDEVLCVIGD